MGKGSNIRPRKVSKEQFDKNFDRIFGEVVVKSVKISESVNKAESKRKKSERAKQ